MLGMPNNAGLFHGTTKNLQVFCLPLYVIATLHMSKYGIVILCILRVLQLFLLIIAILLMSYEIKFLICCLVKFCYHCLYLLYMT